MRYSLRLAIRDWDFMTPIVLGDVRSPDFDVVSTRVAGLVNNFIEDPLLDGAEISFGRYSRGLAVGETGVVALPHFLMQGFRHRCIITLKSSPITDLAGLAGKTIGMDGWPDSGHTWTRALLRRVGIGLEDAWWRDGKLTAGETGKNHPGSFGPAGRVTKLAPEQNLVDMLAAGELDAIFAAFMPKGFYDAASPLRPLLPDYRGEEVRYFHAVGYVPGMHLLALTPRIVDAHPTLPQALSELIDESTRVWLAKRQKYAETTPWMTDEFARTALDLGPDWNRNGYAVNEAMIDDFCTELFAQMLTPRRLTPKELFPRFA